MERSAPQQTAWTVSDGRAGNARQARALAAAMGLAARDWNLAPKAPWRWFAPRRLPGARRAFGVTFAEALHSPPALAIGCGRQAALATQLLRARGTRVVQVLDPRIATSHWDVVVAPSHDALHGDNVVSLLGSLHPVDDAWLAQARATFAVLGTLPRPRVAMLVGGPTRHARWDEAALARWIRELEAVVADEGGSLLLCGSRRTPPALRTRLRGAMPSVPGVRWFDAADGDNPYAGALAWADRIACTPDSVNMLSEACATWAPVFVADPDSARGRVGGFMQALRARDRIRPLDARMDRFEVEPLRETARVAAEVARRLGLT